MGRLCSKDKHTWIKIQPILNTLYDTLIYSCFFKKQLKPTFPIFSDNHIQSLGAQLSGGSLFFVCVIKTPGFSIFSSSSYLFGFTLLRRLTIIQQICELCYLPIIYGAWPVCFLRIESVSFISALLVPSKCLPPSRPALGISECANEHLTLINHR